MILGFYLIFRYLMDSLSMILLTIPICFPVISVMDFDFVDLAALQADAAREVLAARMELTREQMQGLGIRMT